MSAAAWIAVLGIAFVAAWNWGFTAGQRWERQLETARREPTLPNGEPKLEREYDIHTVDRKTLRIVGAKRMPIRHNTDDAARN